MTGRETLPLVFTKNSFDPNRVFTRRTPNWIPTVIPVGILDRLWDNNPDPTIKISSWGADPRPLWFEARNGERWIELADARIVMRADGQPYIVFINGRHRTRWLIELGLQEIPIAIFADDMPLLADILASMESANIRKEHTGLIRGLPTAD